MEETENSVAFYKLFFNNELYHIAEKKSYMPVETHQKQVLSEASPVYVTDGITSKTMIMFNGDLQGADKIFLDQILKAVGLGFEKVTRFNTSQLGENATWDNIASQSASEYIIAFGVDKKWMPGGIEEGQIYNINNKRVLYAATLAELSVNNLRKKTLWLGMKEIYGI